MYTILFFKKKMAAKLLGITFMFRAGEREKGSIPCDNPHYQDSNTIRIPINPLTVSSSSDLHHTATPSIKGP